MTRLEKLEKEDFVDFTEIAIDSFKEDKELYGSYPPFIDEEKKCYCISMIHILLK